MVSVNFWLGFGDEAECIFTFFTDVYPNYEDGDTIWLGVRVTPKGVEKYGEGIKSLVRSLTRYVVVSVQHIARRQWSDRVSDIFGVEVYVKPYEENEDVQTE